MARQAERAESRHPALVEERRRLEAPPLQHPLFQRPTHAAPFTGDAGASGSGASDDPFGLQDIIDDMERERERAQRSPLSSIHSMAPYSESSSARVSGSGAPTPPDISPENSRRTSHASGDTDTTRGSEGGVEGELLPVGHRAHASLHDQLRRHPFPRTHSMSALEPETEQQEEENEEEEEEDPARAYARGAAPAGDYGGILPKECEPHPLCGIRSQSNTSAEGASNG